MSTFEPETKTPCRPGCTNHIDCVIASWHEQNEQNEVFALHPEEIEILKLDRDRFRRALEVIRDFDPFPSYLSVMEQKALAREALES